MQCRQVEELISEYLDGRLTGKQMLKIADHLSGCQTCREGCEEIRSVRAMLRSLQVHQPRSQFQDVMLSPNADRWELMSIQLENERPAGTRPFVGAIAIALITIIAGAVPFASPEIDAYKPFTPWHMASYAGTNTASLLPRPAQTFTSYQVIVPVSCSNGQLSYEDVTWRVITPAPQENQPPDLPLTKVPILPMSNVGTRQTQLASFADMQRF